MKICKRIEVRNINSTGHRYMRHIYYCYSFKIILRNKDNENNLQKFIFILCAKPNKYCLECIISI